MNLFKTGINLSFHLLIIKINFMSLIFDDMILVYCLLEFE